MISKCMQVAFLFFPFAVFAQVYAPPVGQSGTTAMHKDSSAFVAWATGCVSIRGLEDISVPSGSYASVGDNSMALGKAQTNGVISLGDRGSAVVSFANPIFNGPGPDFAVFENSFDDLFLELAFVEVSSDGVNFVRFKSHSLTDTLTQTGSFASTDATKINNFAGKYRGGYGTPFDLQELAALSSININAITHVRIVDVVGSMNVSYATRDGYGNKVNDPWPTAFASGGFDLDAVGVIHETTVTGVKEFSDERAVSVFPNPVEDGRVFVKSASAVVSLELLDLAGRVVLSGEGVELDLRGVASGVYVLRIANQDAIFNERVLVR